MKIPLKERDALIPRNVKGDPAFPTLTAVQAVFTDGEIAEMVNRWIYQAEYSRVVHREKAKERYDALHPVKMKVRELFGVSYIKATPKQVEKALEEVKKEQEKEVGS